MPLLIVLALANFVVAAYLMFAGRGADFHRDLEVPTAHPKEHGDPPGITPDTGFPSRSRGEDTSLPRRFERLGSRGLFDPPGERLGSEPPSDDDPGRVRANGPGFRMIGRVEQGSGRVFGVLRRVADGRVFVVREGKTVGDGSFRLTDVAETTVTLSGPRGASRVITLPEAEPGARRRNRVPPP